MDLRVDVLLLLCIVLTNYYYLVDQTKAFYFSRGEKDDDNAITLVHHNVRHEHILSASPAWVNINGVAVLAHERYFKEFPVD